MPITLDTAALISSLSTGTYTVTRTPAGTFANGVAVPGTPTTLQITAAIYQASGRDLERLPEMRRSVATIKIFTTTQLRTGAQQGQGNGEGAYQADRITYNGLQYEVQQVGRYPGTADFYSCIAQAVG